MSPRIQVLTLRSGENEFEACCASLSAQTLLPADHLVIADLPNAEAHAALYRAVMAGRSRYDLFLKLDADMVLNRPTALQEIAAFFAAEPDLDHIEVKVLDHFTGTLVNGVHVFSPRVEWRLDRHDPLFVDPAPSIPGRSRSDPPGLDHFVDHAPDPGPFQAFHFGYHRALKAWQPGRRAKRLAWARAHWQALRDLRRNYERSRRPMLGLALIAADMVASGRLSGQSGEKEAPAVKAAFEEVAGLSAQEIANRVRAMPLREMQWKATVLPGALSANAALRLRRLTVRAFGGGGSRS